MLKRYFQLYLIVLLFANALFMPGVIHAADNLRKAVAAEVIALSDECKDIARQIEETVPNPSELISQANVNDPAFKKTFSLMHKFYISAFRRHISAVSLASEKEFAEEFFAGFFVEADNQPELISKLNKLVARMKPNFRRKNLNVKVGILSGGGIIGFAKGGEWIVVTDEMANWPEDEIAGVLAHEISHLLKRDYVKLIMANQLNKQIEKSFKETQQAEYKRLMQLFTARWQRFSEYETDIQGVYLMQKSGINAQGMIKVLRKIGSADIKPGQYLALDHPSSQERINAINKYLAAQKSFR